MMSSLVTPDASRCLNTWDGLSAYYIIIFIDNGVCDKNDDLVVIVRFLCRHVCLFCFYVYKKWQEQTLRPWRWGGLHHERRDTINNFNINHNKYNIINDKNKKITNKKKNEKNGPVAMGSQLMLKLFISSDMLSTCM